ncbi:MAG: hypothetical protein Q8L59_14830 [Phenylobacterium sp.]|uniref:calcium-binding protein n=1 Tax=Phenylobacterium sp. TaxID=1871053 RepID=UPI002733D863|nr:hypothetical protein [Phenylobacterium sp.]MDP1643448.1 hypothetical protein [Phenylobacterium sp.]MDP3118692.1 hypothetical protein [Phenylobacterium sp.]
MAITVGTTGHDSLAGDAATQGYVVGLEGNDTLAAQASMQTLLGMAGDDVLIGADRTTAKGGDGADLLRGVTEGFGGSGDDTIIGAVVVSSFGANLHGGPGNDSIVGSAGGDWLSGGGGSNTLHGGAGNDIFMLFDRSVETGLGGYVPTTYGDGDPGSNTIDGGSGVDEMRLGTFWGDGSPTAGDMIVDFASGLATTSAFTHTSFTGSTSYIPAGQIRFSNIEVVETGSGNDSIQGGTSGDRLTGNYGADTIQGGGGADTIMGDQFYARSSSSPADAGNLLRGEDGDDSIAGGAGGDVLDGGAGADTLEGREGADVLTGGDGDDRLIAGKGADTLTGGAGADTFVFADDLDAREGAANLILDWSSADRLDFLNNLPNGYTERTAATYQAAYDDAQAVVRAAPVSYVATQVGSDVIVFVNNRIADGFDIPVETTKTLDEAVILRGRTLADISAANIQGAVAVEVGAVSPAPTTPLQPTPQGSTAFGGYNPTAALNIQPADKVSFPGGANQATVLFDGATITVVMGGVSVTFGSNISAVSKAGGLLMADGSSLFIGDAGNEAFVGGFRGDAAYGGLGDDTLDGGAGADLLQGNQGRDHIFGGDGADTIYGGKDDDTLFAGEGQNFAQGNLGRDIIRGGGGAETLLGGKDNDTVSGDGGGDFLNGNMGDDSIAGGAGDDTLFGEGGSDTLSGGAGADVFGAFLGQGLDQIVDFNPAEGDRIRLLAGMSYSVTQSGADAVVSLGAGDQFILTGVSASALSGDWIGA